ncbi:MAG: TAT-variant-translocated molybdopterin oxidoreductase [Ignavibacteria bacterium]|nr:TAT-variant-translocated molybdopterin oxidoreductase [Ignavibacteria bacterium]
MDFLEKGREDFYWKSLKEYYKDSSIDEVKANEFLSEVTSDFNVEQMSGMSRRKFLALLSASVAFAAVGCQNYRDKGEIIPYTKKPEEITIGKANYYASTCAGCNQHCGILIKTREGRPIKVDGNPDHPINKGKICAKGQANILNLYSPDRLKQPLVKIGNSFQKTDWQNIDTEIKTRLEKAKSSNKEISIITHKISSPTQAKLFEDFKKKYPTTKVYSYDLFNEINRQNAWEKCYGDKNLPSIKWENAKVILALESDFLGTEGFTIEQTRKFTENRDVMKSKEFNRLYCVESAFSLTGSNADYRIKLKPELQTEFLLCLLKEISSRVNLKSADEITKDYDLNSFAKKNNLSLDVLNHLVNDLLNNRGKSIVHAGSKMSEEVHILTNLLNEALGNTNLYSSNTFNENFIPYSSYEEFKQLVDSINKNNIEVIIHFDTNPIYHLPQDLDYVTALSKVPTIVSLVESENETSEKSHFVLPIHHNFESWGDFKVRSDVFSLAQPVISPLYKTRQKEAILLSWLNDSPNSYTDTIYHQYLMENWKNEIYPKLNRLTDFQTFWYSALHDGVVKVETQSKKFGSFNYSAVKNIVKHNTQGISLVLCENLFLYDGRNANNGWLQEIPHPISKVVWDNYAALSPKTAKEVNVKNNDVIEISSSGRKLNLPVMIQPGMADDVVAIDLGYGRTKAGAVGENVGVNANVFISAKGNFSNWIIPNINIKKTNASYMLVSTQEHHSLDDTFVKDFHLKRKIINELILDDYKSNPKILKSEHKELESITKSIEYKGVKWGMSIDLNKCIGCAGCTSACISENNIPVVGKDQVEKGREMHWIRIDRYYSGTPDEPKTVTQPMLCQHCDNAPCENVCPVAATNHSPDGLNQMAYNRCVGTRYCSNNCPYKVRRFNFFDFRTYFADGYFEQQPIDLLHNPEVTVRSRGVMEKCTFCIQRIMEARQIAIEEGRELKGSDVMTACQQACPSNAIVFGDINDKNSQVSKYRNHELGYHVLEELNVKPNVTYIAKLRNIHSEKV